MSKAELGQKLESSPKTIANWENGRPISDEKIAAVVAWMESRGWRPAEASQHGATVGPQQVAEATPAYGTEDPERLLSSLVGRVAEIRLFQRFADERMGAIIQAFQDRAIKLPEDVAAEQSVRRVDTGSGR